MANISHTPHVSGTLAKSADVNANDTATRNVVNGQLNDGNFTTMTSTIGWDISSSDGAISILSQGGGGNPVVLLTRTTAMNAGDAVIKIQDSATQISFAADIYVQATSASHILPLFYADHSGSGVGFFAAGSGSGARFQGRNTSGLQTFNVAENGAVFAAENLQLGDISTPARLSKYNSEDWTLQVEDKLVIQGPGPKLWKVSGYNYLRVTDSADDDEGGLQLGNGPILAKQGSNLNLVNCGLRFESGPFAVKSSTDTDLIRISNGAGTACGFEFLAGGPQLSYSGGEIQSDSNFRTTGGNSLISSGSVTAAGTVSGASGNFSTDLTRNSKDVVTGDSEKLKVIRGIIAYNTTTGNFSIAEGSGFSIVNQPDGASTFQLTWTSDFSDKPSVTLTGETNLSNWPALGHSRIYFNRFDLTKVIISSSVPAGGDVFIDFIAIGPA